MATEPEADRPTNERVPTGIPELDEILLGGFLRDGIFLIEGDPGSGNTILGNQLCFNHVARGGHAVFMTLLAESHARMLMHIGDLEFFDASAIRRTDLSERLRRAGADGLPGLRDLIRREVQVRGATDAVLDGFAAAADSSDSPRAFKRFLNELQTQATMTGCTFLLLGLGGLVRPAATRAHHGRWHHRAGQPAVRAARRA